MATGNLDQGEQPPAGDLISGVLSDARDLAVAEVDKLKAEAITQVRDVGEEVKVISVAALILTVGAVMLRKAIALGPAQAGLPSWAAFGLVAIVCVVVGIAFVKLRRKVAETAA